MKPIEFYASTEIVIIGQNPEMADYDNPRGYQYGHASYIYAKDARGSRRRLFVRTESTEQESLEPAVRMSKALNARLKAGKLPVAFDRWEEYHPAYGSEAYQMDGGEEELIAWERNLEEEY
jgi:hypothetical protein